MNASSWAASLWTTHYTCHHSILPMRMGPTNFELSPLKPWEKTEDPFFTSPLRNCGPSNAVTDRTLSTFPDQATERPPAVGVA